MNLMFKWTLSDDMGQPNNKLSTALAKIWVGDLKISFWSTIVTFNKMLKLSSLYYYYIEGIYVI